MRSGRKRSTGPRIGPAVIVVVVLVVVVGAVAAWWFFLRSTPQRTVAQFLEAAKAQDEEKLTSLMTEETVKLLDQVQKDMEAQFGGMGAGVSGGPGMAAGLAMGLSYGAKGVGKASIEGDKATVSLQRETGTGRAFGQDLRLVKEGGKWKIDFAAELQMAALFAKAMGGKSAESMKEMVEEMRPDLEKLAKEMGHEMPRAEAPAPAAEARVPTAADPAALVAEGLAAKRAGKFDEAAAKLKEAIAQAPDNIDAHWGLAWVLADQGKDQEAIAHFERVVELTDDQEKMQEAQAAIQRLK